jgi:chromosome segregation ATPase
LNKIQYNKFFLTFYPFLLFLDYINDLRSIKPLKSLHCEEKVYKKSSNTLLLSVLLSFPGFIFSQNGHIASDYGARIVELDKKIDAQREQNISMAIKRKTIIADSAAADAAVQSKIETAVQTLNDIRGAVQQGKNALDILDQSITSFTADRTEKETGLKAAEARLHASVSRFDPEVTEKKKILQSAESVLDKAQKDSIALSKKWNAKLSVLRDSLTLLDHAIARVKQQVDSIHSRSGGLIQDSASAWKKNSDALSSVSKLLQETRRAVTVNDSLVKLRTAELNSLSKDSSATLSSSVKNGQMSEKDERRLDSLSHALQTEKTTIFQMQDKMEQDSIILALTRELQEMRKAGGATTETMEEKQQMIQTFTTRRDDLMRDPALAAMVAAEAKTTLEALNAKLNARLIAIDRSLDSITMAREKISRDIVFLEKEFSAKSKDIVKRIDTLSAFITMITRQGIDLEAQLPGQKKDSAEAAVLRDSANLAFGKKLAPLTKGLKKKTDEYEQLKRERDTLDQKVREQDGIARKEYSAASEVIAAAMAVKNSALADYNEIAAKQQKVREDSSSVTASIREAVNQAEVSMEMKQEELTVKKGRHEKLLKQLQEAKDDSAHAARERKQQQISFQKTLAELQYKQLEGEQAIKEYEAQKAVLRRQMAGK